MTRALTTLHCGLLSLEAETGAVRAWVGGIDYASFQYDHIKSRRQVGSVFKPIVYLAALENGVEPCEFILNEQTTYVDYDNWTPKNADNKYGGYYSMPGALANSVNTISAKLLTMLSYSFLCCANSISFSFLAIAAFCSATFIFCCSSV